MFGDNALESNERFVVQLSNPTNVTLSTPQGIGEIVNDDNHFARCQNVTIPTTVDACTATAVSIDNGSSAPDGSPLTLTQNPAAPYAAGDDECDPYRLCWLPLRHVHRDGDG